MRNSSSTHVLIACVAAIALTISGCSQSDKNNQVEADADVLQDVIAATYPVPGSEVRRGMRVRAFMRGLAIAQCGGVPEPVNGTSDRFAQDLFPDLSLIRKRGFAEGRDAAATIDANCALIPKSIPSYLAWMAQEVEWHDVAYRVQMESKALAPLRPRMAACLRRRTGLTVKDSGPTSFLYSVNAADQDGASRAEYMAWSDAYADCSDKYFATLATELAPHRQHMVEGNGDLVRALAAEVTAAGYTP